MDASGEEPFWLESFEEQLANLPAGAPLVPAGLFALTTSLWYTQHKASSRTRRAGSRHYPRRLYPRWPLLASGDAGLSSRSGRPSQTRSLRGDARGESDGLGSPIGRGHGFF